MEKKKFKINRVDFRKNKIQKRIINLKIILINNNYWFHKINPKKIIKKIIEFIRELKI
jgi:hypothetical protein